MSILIFQSVPERFDLRTGIVVGKRDAWLASRYRGEMHSGTPVFFWMGGDEYIRGAYGWGTIASEPYIKTDWNGYGVDVIYEVKFSNPVLARTLRADRILANMLIFRAPQATNFILSKEEAARFVDLVEASGERVPPVETWQPLAQTIGGLAALALSIGAEASIKGLAGGAFNDAYDALREQAARWAGSDVDALAKNPASAARQAVIAEEIDRQAPDDLAKVRTLALALIEALQATMGSGSVGLDIGRLQAAQATLGLISVTGGVGLRSKDVQLSEDFKLGSVINESGNVVIGEIKTGVSPVDPWPQSKELKK